MLILLVLFKIMKKYYLQEHLYFNPKLFFCVCVCGGIKKNRIYYELKNFKQARLQY